MRITSVQFHGKNAGTGILFPQYKQTLARTNVPMFPFPRGNIPWLLKLRLRSDSVQHTATHCCCPVPAGNDRRIIISWRRAGAEPRGTNRRHQHQQRKRPSHQPHELFGCSAARGGLTDDDPLHLSGIGGRSIKLRGRATKIRPRPSKARKKRMRTQPWRPGLLWC
jgi:hypothetical protein